MSITNMTDSPKDLTESVTAPGRKLEGRGQRWIDEDALFNADPAAYQAAALERMRKELYDFVQTPDGMKWDTFRDIHFLTRPPPPLRKANRYELGAREFTLTYSPKWFASDDDARIAMSKAMDKLVSYHKGEITKLRAVGEVGKGGASHIHCYYELQGGRKITDKNFKRAWKYWDPKIKHGHGFQGGHHESVKCASDFLGYIDKDIEGAWLEINLPIKS